MTNGWVDMKNTDMMLIMGGNPAENHPCGFKWPIEAKRTRNAKMIVVDPRFTRTAAVADLHCQIRAGSDIAFLGGVIHYAIENNRIAKDYLLNYTNAAFIVKPGFRLPGDTDGVFSGFDAGTQTYDKSTWNYVGTGEGAGNDAPHPPSGSAPPTPRLPEKVEFDLSLQNPNCVFQLLRKHYSRYTPEMVERITGIPKEKFLKAADLYTSIRKDGDMKKVSTIIYAVGWTQHSFGTQIIRTAAILQRWPRGRRRQRAARALQHSGRHRHGWPFRLFVRLSESSDARGYFLRRLDETHYADSLEARSVGFVQLLWKHAEICGQLSESPLRRRGH
jgi:formate dehydrogenase major subunit